VAHALVFAGDPVGKRVPFPSHLEWSIREVVNVDILTDQLIRQLTPLQDDLPAIVGESELLPHVPLLTVAQNISEARNLNKICRTALMEFSKQRRPAGQQAQMHAKSQSGSTAEGKRQQSQCFPRTAAPSAISRHCTWRRAKEPSRLQMDHDRNAILRHVGRRRP
jgi:hypothetical protein